MSIVQNADGTLLVPVAPERKHAIDDADGEATAGTAANAPRTEPDPVTRLLHPGEGGYDRALAEWKLQQACRYKPTVLSDRVRAIGLARNLSCIQTLVVGSVASDKRRRRIEGPSGGASARRHGPFGHGSDGGRPPTGPQRNGRSRCR